MKKLLFLVFILIVSEGFSQDDIQTQLENMSPPNSPAFTLMDISPSSVYTPASLKALSIQALNSLNGNPEDGFLKNFAVEIVPFWYTQPKNLNLLSYYNLKKTDPNKEGAMGYTGQNIFGDLFKKASVSIAYMDNTFDIFETSQTFLSVGARTTVIKVLRQQDINKILAKYNAYDNYLKTDKEIEDIMVNAEPEDINRLMAEQALKRTELQLVRDELETAINVQPVFTLDIATAYSKILKSQDTLYSDNMRRIGVWLSSDLALPFSNNENNFIHIYGVARYMEDGVNIDPFNNAFTNDILDIGGKVAVELDKLTMGYEYLSRDGDADSYRSMGTIHYQISESFSVNGGFGKNFTSDNDTISLLGVSWSLDTGEGFLTIPKPDAPN